MRESFTYGSVRGAGSNPSPYRDRRAAFVSVTGRLVLCRFCLLHSVAEKGAKR